MRFRDSSALHNRTVDMALGGCIAESSGPDEFVDAVLTLCDVEACDDALQRIEEEMLCTPLVYGHATVLHARHLCDVSIEPDGFLALADVKIAE